MLKLFCSGIRPTRRNSGRLNDEVYPTRRRLNLNNELFREKSIKKFNNDGISGQDMHFSDTGKPTRYMSSLQIIIYNSLTLSIFFPS